MLFVAWNVKFFQRDYPVSNNYHWNKIFVKSNVNKITILKPLEIYSTLWGTNFYRKFRMSYNSGRQTLETKS